MSLSTTGPSRALRAFTAAYQAPSPEAAMRIACRRLLQDYGITTPPVPLKRLCRRLGIRVVPRKTLGNATLRETPSGLEIWYNPDKRRWRRGRFTIAHEIAHVLVMAAAHGTQASDYHEIERLCDFGAAELLMPTQAMQEALATHGVSPTGLRAMYDLFLVSYESLLFRIADILPSSAMILWQRHARTPSEPIALRVRTCYQRYRSNRLAPWLPKGCTTKHISPDIVTDLGNTDASIYVDELVLVLSGRHQRCRAVGTVLPRPRTHEQQLPLFERMPIADEPAPGIDAVLLVGAREMTERDYIWERLALSSRH